MARPRRWLWVAALALAGVAVQILVHVVIARGNGEVLGSVLAFVSGTFHTTINVTLLWFFGRTLRPGCEPLITGFARRFHGTLPPEIARYTRHATVAWTVFFAAQLVISAVLVAVSLEHWSLFVNVLAWPLVITMFVAEYVYRITRFRGFAHSSIWDGVRAFADRTRGTHG